MTGQANKMSVCENPGGQKNVHQAGRESIFFPNFQTIHTNLVFKGTKEISGRLKSKIATNPSIKTITMELVMYHCSHSIYCTNGAVLT